MRVDEAAERLAEGGARGGVLGQDPGRAGVKLAHAEVQHLVQDLLLRGEVVIDAAGLEPGGIGDGAHGRGRDPAIAELPRRGRKDVGAGPVGLALLVGRGRYRGCGIGIGRGIGGRAGHGAIITAGQGRAKLPNSNTC